MIMSIQCWNPLTPADYEMEKEVFAKADESVLLKDDSLFCINI